MKLRKWQSECIKKGINQYSQGRNHFLVLATPAAGKTLMASELALRLFNKNLIDLVICFSPSSIVSYDFSQSLQSRINERFDGLMGSKGDSLTYQILKYLDDDFWDLFTKYRVFVIFDEIHHCSGSNSENANAWGLPIIEKIQGKARFTIALTGTPWRSDSLPIALSQYCNHTKQIKCDYIYGLKEAVRDKVCRIPQIIAVDNDKITVNDGHESNHFNSFSTLLSQSTISYSNIVENELVIEQLLIRAIPQLDRIRKVNSDSGGLIVAASIPHAWQIHSILQQNFNEDAIVVTSEEDKPNNIIKQFRYNSDRWIISVGMISEGTNIPRLQVCCNLTNIKTEMHFRQILGRNLRVTDSPNQEAIMFIPAEPKLVEYAYRVNQDIPSEASIVKLETMDEELEADINLLESVEAKGNDQINTEQTPDDKPILGIGNPGSSVEDFIENDDANNYLTTSYEKTIGIFGRFKHEALDIEGFG